MLALNVVKQIELIEKRASEALQAYASGEDSQEFVITALTALAAIFVEIHECDGNELAKIQAFGELVEDVEGDRIRNKKVYFDVPLP